MALDSQHTSGDQRLCIYGTAITDTANETDKHRFPVSKYFDRIPAERQPITQLLPVVVVFATLTTKVLLVLMPPYLKLSRIRNRLLIGIQC